jgi:uncharacterized ubiquitin-like protein YukD
MTSDTHINVTLHAGARRVDVRIPVKITVYQLLVELGQIFPDLGQPARRYQLRIPTKGLLLTEEDTLSRYPLATGDILEVM